MFLDKMRIIFLIILVGWVLSLSACASMVESGFTAFYSSTDLVADATLKLSDVIEASWRFYENNSEWPVIPDDIKDIDLDSGKHIDLSIYNSLEFKINSENILIVNFIIKPYEFKDEKSETTFYTSKINGILKFHPILDKMKHDAWIMFIQFEAKGKGPDSYTKNINVILQDNAGGIYFKEFISRWNRIKDGRELGTQTKNAPYQLQPSASAVR